MSIQGPTPPQIPFIAGSQNLSLSSVALAHLASLLAQIAEQVGT